MSPEVLNQEHYKKPSDIYSFSITIYECIKWGKAYPINYERFKFPWKIADFIMKGNRLQKPESMKEIVYSFISECWCQEPKERLEIVSVLNTLEKINKFKKK